jgi:transketolase
MDTKLLAKKIRFEIICMSHRSKASHLASSLSCADIITVLYEKILKNSKTNKKFSDKFILSKGHAATSLYTILSHKKVIKKKDLYTYAKKNSLLEEHPNPKLSGVEAPTGSLGHGLSIGCGMALAGKILKSKLRTFVLLGDGECNEGSVWEAALFAVAKKLNNLTAIVDYNKWQGTGNSDKILALRPLYEKWKSFGWNVVSIDGHNHKKLVKNLKKKQNKPTVIIANTIKGKGVSFMENDNNWHYRIPTLLEVQMAKKELGL